MFKKILSFIVTVFLFANTSFAAIEWNRFDAFQNSGGLNDGFSATAIEDNEASSLQNIVLSTYGSFATRGGYAKLNSATLGASVVCTGLKYYSPISGSKYLIGVFDNDKIYKMDYGVGSGPDGTWDDITGVASFNATQNNLASFAIGEDTLIIEDGVSTSAPYKWTSSGSVAALGGDPPLSTMVAFHKNTAFAAGNATYPSLLYFSDTGNIENWTTGLSGNVAVETNDGSVIRVIIPGFDALYIFKDYSIWRLTGDDKDNFQLQRMVSGVGCRSPNAVSRIGNDFYFVDGQGNTYLYDGAIKLKLISTKVQGTIDGSSFSRWQYVSTVQFEDDFYISFSNTASGTHNRILVFDSFNLGWVKFVGMNANAIAVADDGTGKDEIIFGDYSGFVYEYPSGEDDAGTAIDAYYVTKQFSFPSLNINKDLKLLNVYAKQEGNYNLSVETRKDMESTGTTENINLLGEGSLWGTAVYGVDKYGGQNIIVGRIEVNKEGKFFQIKFSNNNLDEPFEVMGYQMLLENSDRI
jgi:hypothetical protein